MNDFKYYNDIEKNLKLIERAKNIYDTISELVVNGKLQHENKIDSIGKYFYKSFNERNIGMGFVINFNTGKNLPYFEIECNEGLLYTKVECEFSIEAIYKKLKDTWELDYYFNLFIKKQEQSTSKKESNDCSKNCNKLFVWKLLACGFIGGFVITLLTRLIMYVF